MLIDKFGRPKFHRPESDELDAYIEDSSTSGVRYICYDSTENRIIWRETTAGNVLTREFSYGKWDDRATLSYVPINSQIEVTD